MGKVRRILGFGAIVSSFQERTASSYFSACDTRVKEVSDILKEGDDVLVKVLDIDPQGRIRSAGRLPSRRRRNRDEGKTNKKSFLLLNGIHAVHGLEESKEVRCS